MAWLKGLAGTLIATLLTTVLLAAFQRPITDFFTPDRLVATIEAGPWYPVIIDELKYSKKDGSTFLKSVSEQESPFARMTIKNGGFKKVTGIKIKFISQLSRTNVIIPGKDIFKSDIREDADTVELSDLNPGESHTIYLIDYKNFGKPYWMDDVRTFSSEGAWRMNLYAPESIEDKEQGSAFYRFIDEWIPIIFVTSLIGLVAISLIGWTVSWIYVRDILSNEKFYLIEKDNFLKSPKKFVPNIAENGEYVADFLRERRKSGRIDLHDEKPSG